MKKRKIGNSGLEVSPYCLGGNVFGWTVDEPNSFNILDLYLDSGFEFIDTADIYSKWLPGHIGGESETILGKWMKQKGNRKQVILATKVGSEMSPEKKGLSKSYILKEVEDSLKRLQTDYIDLYQSHQDDEKTSQEETLEAYDLLVKQGKVRAIGASNFRAERLSQSLEISKQKRYSAYVCLQPHYNLYERSDYETNLEPLCLEKGVGVISYFSLAKGFLTGKYRSEKDLDKSPRGQGVKNYLNERGFRILKALDEIAQQYKSTPARVSLAWLIARPSITAPIASATTVDQLKDILESTKLELDKSTIELLNQASVW